MKKVLENIIWATGLYMAYNVAGFLFGNHQKMIVVTLIATAVVTILYFKNKPLEKGLKGFLLLVAPFLILFTTISFFSGFKRSLVYLIFMPSVYFLAWYFIKIKKSVFILVVITGLIIVAPAVFIPNVYSYYFNTNARQNKPLSELKFISNTNEELILPRDKVVVLDFWTTSCGVCFKKFPEYEALYQQYKNNPNIEFYSVNMPLRRDKFSRTLKLVDSLGYNYRTIYAASYDDINETLDIRAYPTFIVIKDSQLRFKGSLQTGSNIFIYNSKNEIDKLLNEKSDEFLTSQFSK